MDSDCEVDVGRSFGRPATLDLPCTTDKLQEQTKLIDGQTAGAERRERERERSEGERREARSKLLSVFPP